ncbi:hypothetical protein BJ742DRAFT_273335 [Cladochytrium replicatum]|nr:hypothetical protein BJ742DRAFT_273335 [Cladochytrium replicatum]
MSGSENTSHPQVMFSPSEDTQRGVAVSHDGGEARPADRRLKRDQTSLAMVEMAGLYAKYNTIDFEEPDGPNLRSHYARQSFNEKFLRGGKEIILLFFFAVVISFLWIGLFYGTEIVTERRIELVAELLDESPLKAVGVAIAISLACAMIPAMLVVYVAVRHEIRSTLFQSH